MYYLYMATTIETPNGTLTSAAVIWDRDHGTRNEGWYLQLTYTDGRIEDDANSPVADLDADETDAELRSAVKLWLMPPDGLSPDEMDALESMIQVRR